MAQIKIVAPTEVIEKFKKIVLAKHGKLAKEDLKVNREDHHPLFTHG